MSKLKKGCPHPTIRWDGSKFFCRECFFAFDPPITSKVCIPAMDNHNFALIDDDFTALRSSTRKLVFECQRCLMRAILDVTKLGAISMSATSAPIDTPKRRKQDKTLFTEPTISSASVDFYTTFLDAPQRLEPDIVVARVSVAESPGTFIQITLGIQAPFDDWMDFYGNLVKINFELSRCLRFPVVNFLGVVSTSVISNRQDISTAAIGGKAMRIPAIAWSEVDMQLQGDRESWLNFYRALRDADYRLARLFEFEKRPWRENETKIIVAEELDAQGRVIPGDRKFDADMIKEEDA